MRRRTGRGFLMGALTFVVAIFVLVLIIPDGYAWVGTIVALVLALVVGRAAANPAPVRPPLER